MKGHVAQPELFVCFVDYFWVFLDVFATFHAGITFLRRDYTS